MDYNYNRIFDELRQLVTKSALIGFVLMGGLSIMVCLLTILGILPPYALWTVLWLIPFSIMLVLMMRYNLNKLKVLAKKQQISMMANHAKQVIADLSQQFPDTYVNDCRTKMEYLSKNGIDVNTAVERLNNNVDSYNELALNFLHESDRLEDELYSLMHPDTLQEYAQKAHTLRVNANDLGLVKLTDTAFFMEMEAFVGKLDILRDNWKKLSFEMDESYHILSEYTKSLESNDKITFKMWGERLQEAFSALEVYDTNKAKDILNELMTYKINSEITNALGGIITNIDEMMAK
jgi:HPt (histidine-containing phosphotransfer) domain-containing protein